VQVDHLTNRFNQLIQIQSLEPDLILIKKGLQEVVWFNCGGKSSVCRVKKDVSWVARN
jgi:hypothetical protein